MSKGHWGLNSKSNPRQLIYCISAVCMAGAWLYSLHHLDTLLMSWWMLSWGSSQTWIRQSISSWPVCLWLRSGNSDTQCHTESRSGEQACQPMVSVTSSSRKHWHSPAIWDWALPCPNRNPRYTAPAYDLTMNRRRLYTSHPGTYQSGYLLASGHPNQAAWCWAKTTGPTRESWALMPSWWTPFPLCIFLEVTLPDLEITAWAS